MKSASFLPTIAAALLLAPVLSSAQPPDAPPNQPAPRRAGPGGRGAQGPTGAGPVRQRMMERQEGRQALKAELGLSDAQKTDIRKAMETATRDRLRKSTDMKIASMDLKSLLRADKVDEKAVGLKLAEVQAAQGALLKLRVDSALAMKRILTPEQQKKMAEMRGHRGMGRGQGRARREQFGSGQGRSRRPGMRSGLRDDDSDLDDLDLFDDLDDAPFTESR